MAKTNRFLVKHHQPVWEILEFPVDLPNKLPKGYTDPVEYIKDHEEELREAAEAAGRFRVHSGELVKGVEERTEVVPAPM